MTIAKKEEGPLWPLFRWILVLGMLLVTVASHGDVSAAGTATVTRSDLGANLTKYSIAWTSTAGGAVSANLFTVRRGFLVGIKFVPGSGGSQPTDLYDVTLVDTDSVDQLGGMGANLSNATSSRLSFDPPLINDGVQQLDLVVANAGNAKTGTVILWIQ